MMSRQLIVPATLCFLSACGVAADAPDAGGGVDSPDAVATANPDAQPGGPRGAALIVPIQGDTPEIAIMTIYDDGLVDDQGLRLPTGPAPRRAAVHPNGREAAIIWAGGGPGSPKGVTFIDLTGDPSVDSVVSFELDFNVSDDETDYQQSPTDLIYVNEDELLITLRGPGVDGAIPALRTATGWELGKLTVIDPGGLAAPLEVHGIPGTDDALVMTFPDNSRIYTIRRTGAGIWDQVGDFHELDTSSLRLAIHPGGSHAYVASSAPALSDPLGRLHILTPGADGAWLETGAPYELSGGGSQVTIHPEGDFAVMPDIAGTTDSYNFLTIDLSDPSQPSEAANSTNVDGFLMRDFEIGPNGQMIVSLDLPNGGGKVLYTMVQSATPGIWTTVWGPTAMPAGVDDVAVAQVSRVID